MSWKILLFEPSTDLGFSFVTLICEISGPSFFEFERQPKGDVLRLSLQPQCFRRPVRIIQSNWVRTLYRDLRVKLSREARDKAVVLPPRLQYSPRTNKAGRCPAISCHVLLFLAKPWRQGKRTHGGEANPLREEGVFTTPTQRRQWFQASCTAMTFTRRYSYPCPLQGLNKQGSWPCNAAFASFRQEEDSTKQRHEQAWTWRIKFGWWRTFDLRTENQGLRVKLPREARDRAVVIHPYLQHSRTFDLRTESQRRQCSRWPAMVFYI